jgi:hypothetical protein
MDLLAWALQVIGLSAGLVGALLVAFAYGPAAERGTQQMGGIDVVGVKSLRSLKSGLLSLAFGFVLQAIGVTVALCK